jgi:drug/metabolite transporter (DMT)-like permease
VLAVSALDLLCTAAAFTLYYWLIDHIGEGRAALASYLMPECALLYGVLLLSEPLTVAAVIGLVLIIAGAERNPEPQHVRLSIRAH